jgi:hypothetical protein
VVLQVSRKLGVDYKLASLIYSSYWKFIREHISSIPIEDMKEEDFKDIVTNFNIPYIGKLYTSHEELEKYNNKLKYFKNYVKTKENQTAVQSGVSD